MERLELGYVARAHGLHGELRIHLHAEESTTLFDVERAWIGGQERKIVSARPTNGAVLLTIEGVDDREAADALRGSTVEVERADVVLEEGEYLLGDLPGCTVVDAEGRELGRVVEVIPAGQPILVIHGDDREIMIPLVPEFVLAVDVEARRIVVEPPEDLPAEPLRR